MQKARAPKRPIQIQDRDIEVLNALFESRVMTTRHIAMLHFAGRCEMTKKRLQRLSSAGLLFSRSRSRFEPSVFSLTRAGLVVLQNRGILAGYPSFDIPFLERRARVSEMTLQHELEVMDVKVAIIHAARQAGVIVQTFSTWPHRNQFPVERATVRARLLKPDGFLRIERLSSEPMGHKHSFYVEVDRSTESQAILADKANGYLHHYRSEMSAARNREAHHHSRRCPFRVLFILKNAERRNNTTERLLHNAPPILTQIWLTTLSEVVSNPFGDIWVRPLDYRRCLLWAKHDVPKSRAMRTYARQTEREKFVEANTPKRNLFWNGPS